MFWKIDCLFISFVKWKWSENPITKESRVYWLASLEQLWKQKEERSPLFIFYQIQETWTGDEGLLRSFNDGDSWCVSTRLKCSLSMRWDGLMFFEFKSSSFRAKQLVSASLIDAPTRSRSTFMMTYKQSIIFIHHLETYWGIK